MENVQKTYTAFHNERRNVHIYPTEWVIRTFLGKYQNLNLDKAKYKNANLLDLGFGDCRNMPLLNDCGFKIHGVEIHEEIIASAELRLHELGITADLRLGTNASIPYQEDFFEYVLACHSCYYIDKETSFNDNIIEIARILRKDGVFIASLPAPGNFILKDSVLLENGHIMITNDVFNLRNGYIFRTFENEEEVKDVFSSLFKNISVCKCMDNFWGLQINFFIVSCEKK
jgi:SAM-dependent methyltransferase